MKAFSLFSIAILSSVIIMSLCPGEFVAKATPTTMMVVSPSQSVVFTGESINISVNLNDVNGLAGWEFKLYWNNTVLNCTSAFVQGPPEWNNTLTFGPGLDNNYNATFGRFYQGQTQIHADPSFNGSTTLVTFTFLAIQPGNTSLTLTGVILGDRNFQAIDCLASNGSIDTYYGRYMRSDTATVNGLNAFILNATETTSYTVAQKAGPGLGAEFGIRAWVRASNGSEYEITLDGQTGTPEAIVESTGWGTVLVTQKSMQTTFSLVVRVYVSIDGGAWTSVATFTTEQLGKTSLLGATWSVYYYVSVSYIAKLDRTTARFYWGDVNHMSRIQNLQFS